jgi:hypothetical protein
LFLNLYSVLDTVSAGIQDTFEEVSAMEAMGTISGGAIVVKKLQAGTTISNAGVPVIGSTVASSDFGMVEPMTVDTILTAGNAGVGVDTTGTIAATGMTDDNDTLISVALNPDLLIRAKMSNGATADTALAINPAGAADATGADTGVTTLDDSAIWGYDGANKGQLRCTDTTTGDVALNFTSAIAATDNFLIAAGYPFKTLAAASPWPELTTSLTQIDSTTVNNDTDNFVIYDMQLGTEDDDGANNSFYLLVAYQHVLGSFGTSA